MVVLYNNQYNILSAKINQKKYKNNKQSKRKISRTINIKRITLENKNFLKSLDLKVLV